MSSQLGNSRTPTTSEMLRAAIDSQLRDLYVALPGQVLKYNPTTQKADIKPLLKRAFVDEDGNDDVDDLPIITNVPVLFPRGGGYFLSLPITVGDNVLLLFNDRSIDLFLSSSGTMAVDPIDFREHDISDAVALPGFFPDPRSIKDVIASDAVFGKEKAGIQIRLTSTGTVEINFANEAGMSAMLGEVFQAFWDTALTGFQALLQKHVHLSAAPGSPTGPSIDPTSLLPILYPSFPPAAKSKKLKISSIGELT